MMTNGVDIYYLTVTMMKPYKISSLQLGPLFVRDVVLELNGEKVWFFHGDIFDLLNIIAQS